MLAAVPLSVATVAVVQGYAEPLRHANETITLIERVRRHEPRLQRAYHRMRNRQGSIDLASAGTKFTPLEWVAAETQLGDQLYFSSWPSVRSCADGTSWSTSGTTWVNPLIDTGERLGVLTDVGCGTPYLASVA